MNPRPLAGGDGNVALNVDPRAQPRGFWSRRPGAVLQHAKAGNLIGHGPCRVGERLRGRRARGDRGCEHEEGGREAVVGIDGADGERSRRSPPSGMTTIGEASANRSTDSWHTPSLIVVSGLLVVLRTLELREGISVLIQHAVALHVLVPSVGPVGNREWEETNKTNDDE